MKYEDLDGDGKITTGNSTVEEPGDLRKIGNSTPRYRFGLNLATGYNFRKAGRLDLSLFFEGVAKRDLFMGSTYFTGDLVSVILIPYPFMKENIWIFTGMRLLLPGYWNIWG